MADTPKVYVLCDANCKWEGLTKEQILTAITQAVSTGEIGDIDTGFVQTIKTINGKGLKFFVGERSEYDVLSDEDKENLFAIITNDITRDELITVFESLYNRTNEFMEKVQGMETGDVVVGAADTADCLNAQGTTGTGYNDVDLPIVFLEGVGAKQKAHSSNAFTYKPSKQTLKVLNIDGKATEAAHADKATQVELSANTTANDWLDVWFSRSADSTASAYNQRARQKYGKFRYNPSTDTLQVSNITGNAATATTARYVKWVTLELDEQTITCGKWYTLGTMPNEKTIDDIILFVLDGINDEWAEAVPLGKTSFVASRTLIWNSGDDEAGVYRENYSIALQITDGKLQFKIALYTYEKFTNKEQKVTFSTTASESAKVKVFFK